MDAATGYQWEQFGAWIRDVPASCLGCTWVWSPVAAAWIRWHESAPCAWHRPHTVTEGKAA